MTTFVALLALALACTTSDALQATDLRVDYLTEPALGIQNPNPHFSWKLDSPVRGTSQQSFRLTVHDVSQEPALYDSGVVSSSTSTFVSAGLAGKLKSNTKYKWTVSVGDAGSSSTFTTGLMDPADWTGAEWLESSNNTQVASQMRRDFQLADSAQSATLFLCVPGYGTVHMNGARVDSGAGIRSWSQYDVRALYSSYDVTQLVRKGNNTLGVYTGRGWYSHFGYGPPTLRAVLLVTLGSGVVQRITSDTTWTETAGPVGMDDEYNGETYDATMETPGWDDSGFIQGPQWSPVKVATTSNMLQHTVMDSAAFPAVERIQTFSPKSITEPSPGVWVFDFDQNLSGWCRLRITAPRGTRIQLRHAEALQHPPYGPRDGNIYVGNLRSARATDVYVAKGDPAGEVFEPYFTQHGFRYVEITGLNQPASVHMLEAVHVRSAVETTGSVGFSDPLLNQVQHNLYWGQSTNLMMVPTDCDQRDERLGWTGDSALTAEEAIHNFDMGAFFINWAQMLDETSTNGAIGCTVPGGPNAVLPASKSCDASWSSVYPTVLHGLLKYYGDTATAEKHWSSLKRLMDNEYSRIEEGGVTNMFANFGDWVPPPPAAKVDIAYTSTFSFLNDLRNVGFMAQQLGHLDDANKYQGMFDNVSALFHNHWFNTTSNTYADGGQTANALALHLKIVPPEAQPAVVAALVADIEARGNHTSCGIIGWRFECEVLSSMGHADVAYALMTQTTYPSYGFEIKHAYEPATTIWELWDGPVEGPGMNSRDHIMFGGPGAWLFSYLGGITQTADSIGFKHAVFAPPAQLIQQALTSPATHNQTWSAPLKFASVSKTVPLGQFSLSWQVQDATAHTCADAVPETLTIQLQCPDSTIHSFEFAAYGTATGSCSTGFTKSSCNADLVQALTPMCIGKQSCEFSCDQGTCAGVSVGDPCLGTAKHVSVQVTCAGAAATHIQATAIVPPNAVADTVLPILGNTNATISESGVTVWAAGKYVSGAPGVTGASVTGDAVSVSHGSGDYEFLVKIPK